MAFTILGLDRTKTTAKALQEAIKPTPSLMTEVAKALMNSIQANFDAQGRPSAWQPNALATIRKKGSNRILRDTGRLERSIEGRASNTSAEAKTNLKYGYVNHFGSAKGRTPARPFMTIPDVDIPKIEMIQLRKVDEALKK